MIILKSGTDLTLYYVLSFLIFIIIISFGQKEFIKISHFFFFLFQLLNTEKLPIFASVLQVSFLLFESLRTHLKFQLERYLSRLTEIIVSDSSKISYEHREIALG